MISARRAPTPSPHRARASSYDFNTHPSDHRSRVPPRARAFARASPQKLSSPPLRPQYDHRAAPDTRSHISVGRRARGQTTQTRADFDRFARASGVTRARPLARDASRAPLAPIVARSRSPRARDVPARRRERTRARAHLIKIEPARGARSRDEALARRRPGRRRGDQAVRTRRDATTMRSRVDASARRARARRDDDARRGIRDEIGAEFSCRLRRDDGRPTDDRGRRARREDDEDARGDECAMTDDARAIADGRQAGSGGRER